MWDAFPSLCYQKSRLLLFMLELFMTTFDTGLIEKKCISQQIRVKHMNRNGLYNLSFPVNANVTEAGKKA